MKPILIILTFCLTGCFSRTEHNGAQTATSKKLIEEEYVWTKLPDSADWKKSYNFQMFSINDTL